LFVFVFADSGGATYEHLFGHVEEVEAAVVEN
jgi:hypothetical protein